MDLVLFDVDGTLIHSMADDGECLVTALQDVFGFADINDDWSCYEHCTDAGIVIEAYAERRGSVPSAEQVEELCDHFAELLAARCATSPLREVAGAGRLLAALGERDDISVAYATGCFYKTAVLKMQSAGLAFEALPAATCDDAVSRHEIMLTAISRASSLERVQGFENIVYVGDAIWDVWACRKLGLPFIGVTADIAADQLRTEGADLLLPDFSDQELFHQYRERCSVGRR